MPGPLRVQLPRASPLPLFHARLPVPRPPRSPPSRAAPREGSGGGPGRPALIGCRRAPRPCARAGGGAGRGGRARRGSADGASVTLVRPRRPGPGRDVREVGAGGGGAHRLGAPLAPTAPSRPGGAPHSRPARRPAGNGSCPRGRRRRPPGSPDVAAPRGGAADALLGPGRRLVLKGQRRARAGGGGASCPCARPLPQGTPRRPPPRAPPPVGCSGSAGSPAGDGRRWLPGGQVFLRPNRGRWRRAGPRGAGL